MAKVLIAEDDAVVSEAVIDLLSNAHHVVEHSRDGEDALGKLLMHDYDLVIVDASLPAMSGVRICEAYRARGGIAAWLVLTADNRVPGKVQTLDAGADDFLAKPFSPHEFSARVRALLRRPRTITGEVLSAADLTLDVKTSKVMKGDRELLLLPKELILLEFFIRNKNQIFSVSDLLSRLWKSDTESSEDAVRQCIARLRKKIDGPDGKRMLITIKGLGYKLRESV